MTTQADRREAARDRALDRLLAAAPEPVPPADLAARILSAARHLPQQRVAGPGRSWSLRPRAAAATLAAAAVFGFLAGWSEPLLIADAQPFDVAAAAFGPEVEVDQ
ncbi:MAG: hypothetical protein AB7P02_18815 [Alphaproteobacteria bacterium]